ncbi:MAG TPA: EAL domain-containing response regulator [Steroidobacteraceae bacterium]|nr:EAL domain-containing response regulator [Steroidobacteraceae bacterium]
MSSSNGLQAIDSVLIVDDSGAQRGIGAALCRELRIPEVHEAGNGREALALLERLPAPPALFIIDLEMPTMDGPELLSALGGRGIRAPIILASSRERALMNSVQDMGAALGLRIVGALQKPLTLGSLGALLQNKLHGPLEKQGPARHAAVDPHSLRSALARGGIEVHYHPQVEIDTGLIRGVEALARWHDAKHGWIAPDAFIPVAEQHGLIRELTLHVMDAAMRQTALWCRHGLDLSIAINLSPILLERGELVQEISDLQQQHGLRAEQIVLEVTESSLLRDLAIALGVLTRLRLRGFRLSLDDYGTGFSSMQQLARIPFTELKIDRTFVHGAHERDSLQVILRSALEMASQLGIETVAEGVECLQDWRLLRRYGCKLAQGWLLAKAMPGAELESWIPSLQRRRPELQG